MGHEHLIRTCAVAVAFLAVLGVYLYCIATGDAGGAVPRLEGMLIVLAPALFDSARVVRQYRQEKQRLARAFSGIAGAPSKRPRA